MAESDIELIHEVRAITGYTDETIISDSDLQRLIDIGKDEIQTEWPLQDDLFPGYYSGDLEIDRALFWFTCVAAKVHVGELAGMEIRVGSFLDTSPDSASEPYFLRNFQKRFRGIVARAGPAQSQIERESTRTYGDNA